MALEKVVNELRTALAVLHEEKARVEEQIIAIQKLLNTPSGKGAVIGKRGPGRPKGSGKKRGAEVAAASVHKRKKPVWSAEARDKARERMRAYWASRRKEG